MPTKPRNITADHIRTWVEEAGPAAIVLKEWLEPAEGRGAVIFPPTYAPPREKERRNTWTPYVINTVGDKKVCLLDNIGSQANRMEPIFKRDPYASLVPQVSITIGNRHINLLDVGHRAADAIARFSSLAGAIREAYEAWAETGDGAPLARLAPTSIVFGSWDSRGTGVKISRIVRSELWADDVSLMRRRRHYRGSEQEGESGLRARHGACSGRSRRRRHHRAWRHPPGCLN
jgi:CRISPR-associated protein Csb1